MRSVKKRFAILLAGLGCAVGLDTHGAEPRNAPDFRLSGTILAGEVRTAVIEFADGATRLMQSGETLPGWGSITSIEPNSILVAGETGRWRVWVTADEGSMDAAESYETLPQPLAKPAPPLQMTMQDRARERYDELRAQVAALADNPDAGGEALTEALSPVFGLPPEARVIALDFQPISGSSLRALKESLDRGAAVRVSVEGVKGVSMLYLTRGTARPRS
jgi:hypothetical protein